jgi:hypothetical protein
VSYFGLNPKVRQSGGLPAVHGHISKQGRAYARGMLVEAAWVASKAPGPLHAFYERIRARRGFQIASSIIGKTWSQSGPGTSTGCAGTSTRSIRRGSRSCERSPRSSISTLPQADSLDSTA